jgi:hypothetical protein
MFLKVTRKLYGGGGGGGTTTTSTIPPELMPYIQNVMQTSENQFNAGNLGKVADYSKYHLESDKIGNFIFPTGERDVDRINKGQIRMEELAQNGGRDALMESAAYNAAKESAGISRDYGSRGTLGSARQAIQTGTMEAELADRATQQSIQNKLAAEGQIREGAAGVQNIFTNSLANTMGLGNADREISQQKLDSDWQALQRYSAAVYGNPARQQTTASGGGK